MASAVGLNVLVAIHKFIMCYAILLVKMPKKFDAILQEFIDFINQQVGVYMDAMAGFKKLH